MNRRRSTAAFTLMEMLTVIGIMAIIAGIAWAGILGSKRSAGLVGGTELVADLVRQARVTALSTGAPVELRFDTQEQTITGVSQQPVFHVDFETDAGGTPVDDAVAIPGVAGYGLVIGYPGIADPDFDQQPVDPSTGIDPGDDPDHTHYRRDLPVNPPLMRREGDGWLVECWFKAPPLTPELVTALVSAGTADPLPVLRIGTDDTYNTPEAFLGIDLIPVGYDVQDQPLDGGGNRLVSEWRWGLYGWVYSGSLHELDDGQDDQPYHPSVSGSVEDRMPATGGEWERLALHYDGENLVLYRNGIAVASQVLDLDGDGDGDAIPVPTDVRDFDLFIGTDAGTSDPDGDGDHHEGGLIDEIRILRMGSAMPARLPGGVTISDTPAGDRVLIGATGSGLAAGASDQTIELTSETDIAPDGSPRRAEITITTAGQVTIDILP